MTDFQKNSLRAIAEEAANWFIILEENDVSAVDRDAFVNWLKRSPNHVEEFMRVSATHAQIMSIPVAEFTNFKGLLKQAQSNVIDLSHTEVNQTPDADADSLTAIGWSRHLGAKAAMLAALTILVGWLVGGESRPEELDLNTYVTALGEQRSVLLEDGSVVNLNTQSRLEVHFSETTRSVKLIAGEAVFDVFKDATRPFQVGSGAALVEAIGTQFNVYRQASQTVITVMEGRVAVSSPTAVLRSLTSNRPSEAKIAPARSIALNQGSQVTVLETGVIVASKIVDPIRATAWTSRRVVFDGDSLQTVVRELNRYNRKKLLIGDQALSQQTISGVFDANDPETLLAFLQTVGNLQVKIDTNSGDWVLYAAPKSHLVP